MIGFQSLTLGFLLEQWFELYFLVSVERRVSKNIDGLELKQVLAPVLQLQKFLAELKAYVLL